MRMLSAFQSLALDKAKRKVKKASPWIFTARTTKQNQKKNLKQRNQEQNRSNLSEDEQASSKRNTKQLEQQEEDHSDGCMEKETKMRSSKGAYLLITSQVILAQTLRTENFTHLCALVYIRRRRLTPPPPPPPCVQLCERETPQIVKGIANNCEEE
jgi:hypothetical protein